MKDEKGVICIILKNCSFILFRFTTTLWSWLSQLDLLLFPFLTCNILLHILKYLEGRRKKEGWGSSGWGQNSPVVKYVGLCLHRSGFQQRSRDSTRYVLRDVLQTSGLCICGDWWKKSQIYRAAAHQGGQAGTLGEERKLLLAGRDPVPLGKPQPCYQGLSTHWIRPSRLSRIITLSQSQFIRDSNHNHEIPSWWHPRLVFDSGTEDHSLAKLANRKTISKKPDPFHCLCDLHLHPPSFVQRSKLWCLSLGFLCGWDRITWSNTSMVHRVWHKAGVKKYLSPLLFK